MISASHNPYRDNGIKLHRLIENLLSFSAWQKESVGLDLSEFRIRPLIKQVLEAQQLTVVSQRVRLEVIANERCGDQRLFMMSAMSRFTRPSTQPFQKISTQALMDISSSKAATPRVMASPCCQKIARLPMFRRAPARRSW